MKKITILSISLMILIFINGCSNTSLDTKNVVEFVNIPGNEDIENFQMSKTEITNQQYVDFLNLALKENKITVGKIEALEPEQMVFADHKSKNQQVVYDEKGNRMIDLLGIRVTGDHDKDNEHELWEMENPLNRCMIEYDVETEKFYVVDPEKVDWNIYFDKNNLPEGVEPVDEITNWAELHEFWPKDTDIEGREVVSWDKGDYNSDVLFAGHLDLDFELPTLEEVKEWPVNHIEYYGAKAFADFYGYYLPTFEEMLWAAAGGENYEYGTDDGTVNVNNTVYSGHSVDEYPKKGKGLDFSKFPGKDKGHVQPVASFEPNPYGVYDLSGNVYEWTRTIDNGQYDFVDRVGNDSEAFIRIGGSWNYYDKAQSFDTRQAKNTGANRGNDHFGFRVVKYD